MAWSSRSRPRSFQGPLPRSGCTFGEVPPHPSAHPHSRVQAVGLPHLKKTASASLLVPQLHTLARGSSPVPIRRRHSLVQNPPMAPQGPQDQAPTSFCSHHGPPYSGCGYLARLTSHCSSSPFYYSHSSSSCAPWTPSSHLQNHLHFPSANKVFLIWIIWHSRPVCPGKPPPHKPCPCDAQSQTPHPGGQSCLTLCQKGGGWALPHFSSLTSSRLFAG